MSAHAMLPRGALARLRRADADLGRIIDEVGPCLLAPGAAEGPLDALARAIVYQQISGKAAATIYGRFRALFGGESFPSPSEILAVDDGRLRGCGLSRHKLGYLRDLCAQVERGALDPEGLSALDDEGAIAAITRVKGFGRWSAQMFLIFHLGRLDVWPTDDLGVRKALARLRGRSSLLSPAQALVEGERYRPYRSVAAWYLWRSLDP